VRALDVWLYGVRIATITEADDRYGLAWSDEATQRWSPGTRVLSAALPVGDWVASPLVHAYLDGLLPGGDARVAHARSVGVPPDDTVGLLRAYGRDTAGAAIFVDAGDADPTTSGRYEPLTDDQVAERLRRADEHAPADAATQGESSTLPGMVPKITLHRDGGAWFACKDGAATTWVIKRGEPKGSPIADVVDTEAACLDLARRMGLTTVEAEVLEYDDIRAIAVSRYDRGSAGERIHQEDLAQAVGLDTSDPNRKYQRGSRMPSIRQAADVLRVDGRPDQLLRLVTFSHLVGNTDLHAKKISFLRDSDGEGSLAPAYGVALHLHREGGNGRFALDVNGKQRVAEIGIDDLAAEGTGWGLPERRAGRVVTQTVADLAAALDEIDVGEHPGVPEEAWRVVRTRVAEAGRIAT
jgi:serine/threonine-protein kinase HipA